MVREELISSAVSIALQPVSVNPKLIWWIAR